MRLILLITTTALLLALSCRSPISKDDQPGPETTLYGERASPVSSKPPSLTPEPHLLTPATYSPTPGPLTSALFPQQIDTFGGSFQGSETVSINRETKVVFQVNPVEDRESASITLSLPHGLELARGPREWQGKLVKGHAVNLEVFVKTANKMQGNIKAEVSSPGGSPGVIETRSYYYEVSTLDSSSAEVESRQ